MVSGVGFSLLQAIAILPREVGELILKDVPDAGLAKLRRSCQSWRVCVDRVTSWSSIYRIFKIFKAIGIEHLAAKPGLTYVIDYEKAAYMVHSNGELIAQSLMFADCDLPITGCVPRTYQVSSTLFICIPSYKFQDPQKVWQFTICSDKTIEQKYLADLWVTIKALSSNFQELPFLRVGKIFQRQNIVQIHIRFYDDPRTFDQHYLLTLEIDPIKVNSCYLGRRKQLIFFERNHGIIEEFDVIGEVETSRKTSFTLPSRALLLHSHGRWLLVKDVTQVPLQVHYIFYGTGTGNEYFRYSLDRNLFPGEIYDADDLCAGVTRPLPPDNGTNFDAEKIFINDSFCLFFQPPSAKVIRAALIWIEKKRIIHLSLETQQILCSFNRITDLHYLSREDGSCELRIEGERDGKNVQIYLTIRDTN